MDAKSLIQRLIVVLALLACVETALFAIQSERSHSRAAGGQWDAVTAAEPVTRTAMSQPAPPVQQQPSLAVSHSLVGNDLKLILTVKRFNFSLDNMGKENRHGEGHAHLYIDGKKVAKIFDREFTWPDLPTGRHEVVVELAHNNHEPYGVNRSFQVVVP